MKRMIRSILSGVFAFSMLCAMAFASHFPDVDDTSDYAEAVEYLYSYGIMNGDENGNFNPDKAVTRAEMAALICRVLSETENLEPHDDFFDVPQSHWANGFVSRAVKLGVVNGYGNRKFGPSDTVTFEQAVTMVIRALGLEDEAILLGGYPNGYVELAKAYGFTSSINSNSGKPLDRKEVAQLLVSVMF